MEDNHIIQLFNPKVIKLNLNLVTHRTTMKGKSVRLKHPIILLDALIAVTEPLTMSRVYSDEHNQLWLVMERATDVMTIRNIKQSVTSFRMPTQLVYAFSPAPMDSSAQPQGELIHVKVIKP